MAKCSMLSCEKTRHKYIQIRHMRIQTKVFSIFKTYVCFKDEGGASPAPTIYEINCLWSIVPYCGRELDYTSTDMATAPPPPRHKVARPLPPPRRRSS